MRVLGIMKITSSCQISYLLLTVGLAAVLTSAASTWAVVHAKTPASGYKISHSRTSSKSSNKSKSVTSRNARLPEANGARQLANSGAARVSAIKHRSSASAYQSQGSASNAPSNLAKHSGIDSSRNAASADPNIGLERRPALTEDEAKLASETAQNADGKASSSSEAKLPVEPKADAPSDAKQSEAKASSATTEKQTSDSAAGSASSSSPPSSEPKPNIPSNAELPASGNNEAHEIAREPGTVLMKPGQRLNIAGFAERKPAQVVDENAESKAPQYHRVQMRLTGSMCIACLHEFQEKILQVYGVERAKVEKSETPALQIYSAGTVGNYADGIVYIDASRVELIDLRAYMRVLGYHSYRVEDKATGELPSPGRKKI